MTKRSSQIPGSRWLVFNVVISIVFLICFLIGSIELKFSVRMRRGGGGRKWLVLPIRVAHNMPHLHFSYFFTYMTKNCDLVSFFSLSLSLTSTKKKKIIIIINLAQNITRLFELCIYYIDGIAQRILCAHPPLPVFSCCCCCSAPLVGSPYRVPTRIPVGSAQARRSRTAYSFHLNKHFYITRV